MRTTALVSGGEASGRSPDRLSAAEIADTVGLDGLVDELVAPMGHLLATVGKQLRATLVMRSAEGGASPSDPLVREGAIAVELLHLGTLAHDDVVDDGKLRRGAATVGATHGNLASGFVGAVLVSRATELVARHGPEPTRRIAETATAMCAGQMAEFQDLFDVERSVSRYRAAIAGKTASLFESAAWLGAWLSQSSAQTIEAVTRFGLQLGIAFQIADDILDLTAPQSETGKRQGNDLRQGVYNLPVIYALETDAALPAMLGRGVEDGRLPALVERVERSGGIDRAIGECRRSADAATAALRADSVSAELREGLIALLDEALAPIDRLAAGKSLVDA